VEDIFLNNLDEFKMYLYIIGYKNKGESIIFILEEGNEIYFSSIIDSYKKSNCKIIEKIIEEKHKLKNFDYIFWTHPHEDHSTGLEEIITNYSNKKTVFVLPQDIEFSKPCLTTEENEILKKMIENSGKYKFQKTLVNDGGENLVYERDFISDERVFSFKIKSLAPHSGVIEEIKSNSNRNVNDFSICLKFEIYSEDSGIGYTILLTGDIENKTIKLLNKKKLKEINLLKIPHHASSTSDILAEKIENDTPNQMIACTTSYKTGNLPKKEILQNYLKNYKDIFILGKEKEDDDCDYGVLTLEGNLKEFKMTYYLDGLYEEYDNE
jgi:beta-lactamase superfamily II metal-dependent hydrolase